MKNKQTTKKYDRTKPASIPSKRSSENRGLNSDKQTQRTNVPDDEDMDEGANPALPREDDLVEEEERERKRKVEDARGEEEN